MFDYLSKHCPTDNRQEFWQHGPMNSEQADKLAHGSGFVAARADVRSGASDADGINN
ncbi:hypothetical protein [Mycolicibacterium sp.]|uniref:hypothetical protein n=1 Tax=Mycolicibacterium sp. TaxID=2320850 RepID=UPI0028A80134|nr:hypothetical protein [Mycolicibacterium sp.]